jgi:hypothetical protein
MRMLLAVAIVMGGTLAVSSAEDGARKYRRSAEPSYPYYSYGPQSRFTREEIECERARHEDPSGRYAGYPCWAGEAFGRGTQGGGRGRR